MSRSSENVLRDKHLDIEVALKVFMSRFVELADFSFGLASGPNQMHMVKQSAMHGSHLGIEIRVGGPSLHKRKPLLISDTLFLTLALCKLEFLQLSPSRNALDQDWRKQCSKHCQCSSDNSSNPGGHDIPIRSAVFGVKLDRLATNYTYSRCLLQPRAGHHARFVLQARPVEQDSGQLKSTAIPLRIKGWASHRRTSAADPDRTGRYTVNAISHQQLWEWRFGDPQLGLEHAHATLRN